MKAKRTICINTNEIFDSAKEAAIYFNAPNINTISRICRGEANSWKGKVFRFLDENNNVIEPEKEIIVHNVATICGKGKRSNGNCHAIFDITTGDIYTSCTDAAEGIGIVQSAISAACKGVVKTVRGHKICKVDKLDEHIPEISKAISKANAYDELLFKEHARKELQDFIATKENEVLELTKALNKAKDEIAEAKAKLVYM